MLDINLIRTKPEYVQERLAAKGCKADIDELLAMDAEKRALMTRVEDKKAEHTPFSPSDVSCPVHKSDRLAVCFRAGICFRHVFCFINGGA